MSVQRSQILSLISTECVNFADRFFRANQAAFADLAYAGGRPDQGEQKQEWYEIYKRFCAEAELTVQNTLMLWGVMAEKSYEADFLEAAARDQDLDEFLKLTEYQHFIQRMHLFAQQAAQGGIAPDMSIPPNRPVTPHSNQATEKRLKELDLRLSQLEFERNAILVERRQLVDIPVQPTTAASLHRAIEVQRWKDDVGLD